MSEKETENVVSEQDQILSGDDQAPNRKELSAEEFCAAKSELFGMAFNEKIPDHLTQTQMKAFNQLYCTLRYVHETREKSLPVLMEIQEILDANDPKAEINRIIQDLKIPFKSMSDVVPVNYPEDGISEEGIKWFFAEIRTFFKYETLADNLLSLIPQREVTN
jgi:hypothetical protein